jgi:hypothetical protein
VQVIALQLNQRAALPQAAVPVARAIALGVDGAAVGQCGLQAVAESIVAVGEFEAGVGVVIACGCVVAKCKFLDLTPSFRHFAAGPCNPIAPQGVN